MNLNSRERDALAALLASAGFSARGFTCEPVLRGGNNRIMVVRAGPETLVAKWYFTDPRDPRDRLASEWAFLQFAVNACGGDVPRPVSCDPGGRVALYEFVEGTPLTAADVRDRDIHAAREFFARLNTSAARAKAAALPVASEACFSLADHIAMVDSRLSRFTAIHGSGALFREARELANEMMTTWHTLKLRIERKAEALGLPLETRLAAEERCISPSDFGFHNVIRRPDGALCFLDFEYAGWDDPAKSVADFFLHPANPVRPGLRRAFLESTLNYLTEAQRPLHRRRAELLQPLFGLKWCCIIMNPFIPGWAARQVIADHHVDLATVRSERLRRTRAALQVLQEAPVAAP